jgi:hypothetical protein
MKEKLRMHIDGVFAETIPTRKAVELKEEMIQNLEEKYKDLISEGKTPEAAYNIAIAGIGDVSGLLSDLDTDINATLWRKQEDEAARRKSALLTSVAVMIYILSALPLIILSITNSPSFDVIGLPILFIMVAVATGLLVYNNMSKPTYQKEDDTMVEEFKEWKSENRDNRKLRGAISSALWTIIVVVYFVISFSTGAWHLSWIIFLVGAAAESLINVFASLKGERRRRRR